MLSKLAFRNVKRSAKDYIIYLITITLAFSLIFAFNLLSNSTEVSNLCDIMDNFAFIMYFVNIFIIVIIGFLINYTIKFIYEKRSKEFGTYMLLGIRKKKISKIFLLENMILGFFSLLISIPIGYLFSIFMALIISRIFELREIVKISFGITPILLLILYFTMIYLIVLLLARHRIKKVKIYDLLYLEKQNENKSFKKSPRRNIVFIISLVLGILAMFLFSKEFKGMGYEPNFKMIFLCTILMITSIYGVTITLSDFILSFILKNKKIKYTKDNLFLARTFSAKVRTMSFTLGTLTVLITFTLIALNLSSLCKEMSDYQLEQTAPYDISIKEIDRNEIPKIIDLVKQDYQINETIIYNGYKEPNKVIGKAMGEYGSWIEHDQIIKLSDYNKLLKLKDNKTVSLGENEYLVHVTKELSEYLLNNHSVDTITLSNGISLQKKEVITTGYTYAWGVGYGSIIVVPDNAVTKLEPLETNLIIDTKENTTKELANKITKLVESDICTESKEGYTMCYFLENITVRGEVEANNNGFITIISFVCYYLALIFIAIVGTILAIQSLSDSGKYQYRYKVLNQLGVRNDTVKKTIFKQLFVFFIIPVFYPALISFIVIYSLNKIFKVTLTTNTIYLIFYFINMMLFLLIYCIYFFATYFGFKRNIDKS